MAGFPQNLSGTFGPLVLPSGIPAGTAPTPGGLLLPGYSDPGSAPYSAMRPVARVRNRTVPSATITTFQASHGFVSGGADGSSNLNDTSNFYLGSQAATIVTAGAGAFATLGNGSVSTVDFTGKSVRLWLRTTNLAHLSDLQVYAGTGGLTNYYKWVGVFQAQVDASVNYSQDGEWVAIDLNWQDAVAVGTPNRTTINAWQLRVKDDNTGQKVTINWQAIQAVPVSATYPNGVVSFTFDDSQASAFSLAKPLMDPYGFPGSWYTICDQVGNSGGGFLTLANLQQLYNQGHDVAAHAYTLANHNLTNGYNDMTSGALDTELRAMKEWLHQNGFQRGVDHFASPKGMFTHATLQQFQQYFSSHRTIVSKKTVETLRPSDPFRLRVAPTPAPTAAYTTAAQITALIDNAYANGGWLILFSHQFVTSGASGSLQTLVSDMTTIVNYCNTKGIPVATIHEVLANLA